MIIVFKGVPQTAHYRIYFQENELSGKYNVLEWNKLPNNGVIMFNFLGIPEQMRYYQYISIQFVPFYLYLGSINENNTEFLVRSDFKKYM